MNPTAIYSKSGKGVQEASGKTSLLGRGDRAVLSAIDGRATLGDVAQKVGKTWDDAFQKLITQLDKDGFIREVSAGTAPAPAKGAPAKGAPAAKPGAKPAGKATEPMDGGTDLDFSSLVTPSKPASPTPAARSAPPPPPQRPSMPPPTPPKPAAPPAPPPRPDPAAEARAKEQHSALQKAREEAEAKAQADRDRIKAETEAKMRAETESKLRAETEQKVKAEAEARLRAEADAKSKAVRDAAVKAAVEAKQRAEAEAKARQETERRAKEEIERAKKEAEEEARKAREEAERVRKAAEEEARKAREEAERVRKEAAERERKAREEAERKAKAEAEAMRRQLEEERRRLEEERKREEEERAERRKRDEEEEAERSRQEAAAKPKGKPAAAPKAEAKPAQGAGGAFDSLLADLDSFSTNEEQERKEKEEAERKEREEAARRAKEEAERREREEAERSAKEAERARKDEEKRRKKDEEESLAKAREKEERRLKDEEEKRKKEADERERKAKAEEVLTAQATRTKVQIGEDTDQLRSRMLGKRAPAGGGPSVVVAPSTFERPQKRSLVKPIALGLIAILVIAFGAVHLMPVSTSDYERAASEALGRQVKIGSASLSLYSGLALHFKDVRIGDDVTIANVTGSPEFDALRGERKSFTRIELDGVKATQAALGEALMAKGRGANFALDRLVARRVELSGALALPKPLEIDITFGADGAATSANVRGPDNLSAHLTPKGEAIEVELTASGFPLPVAQDVTLSDFKLKGSATARGLTVAEWEGKILGGLLSGNADIRWGSAWSVDGVMTVRDVNAAVFAPALLSEGKAEGTAKFSLSGAEPSKLVAAGRYEGTFTIASGTLGSFDLAKAVQNGGKTWGGQTQFTDLNGQASYERGSVTLRGVTLGAGPLNAGATLDVSSSGALSGRIIADMKSQRATLNLAGTVKEPQITR
jgi:hypothetical protein